VWLPAPHSLFVWSVISCASGPNPIRNIHSFMEQSKSYPTTHFAGGTRSAKAGRVSTPEWLTNWDKLWEGQLIKARPKNWLRLPQCFGTSSGHSLPLARKGAISRRRGHCHKWCKCRWNSKIVATVQVQHTCIIKWHKKSGECYVHHWTQNNNNTILWHKIKTVWVRCKNWVPLFSVRVTGEVLHSGHCL